MRIESSRPNFVVFTGYIINTDEIEAILPNKNTANKHRYPTLIRMRSGTEYSISGNMAEAAIKLRLNTIHQASI